MEEFTVRVLIAKDDSLDAVTAAGALERCAALGVLAKPYDPDLLAETVAVVRSILEGGGPPTRATDVFARTT